MRISTLPRRGYVPGPTPLQRLDRFSRELGCGVTVWVKRDDLLEGAGGGNKTRKLDLLLAQALLDGVDAVVTCGAVQSNHCRLTLSWAKREGMACHLVLQERVKGSYDPLSTGNNLLFHLLGADGIHVIGKDDDREAKMAEVAEMLRQQGRRPLVIPAGGSTPLGAAGYAVCAAEILAEAYRRQTDFRAVVCPSGSAGTEAGLAAGFAGLGAPDVSVIGINVSRENAVQLPKVLRLADETADFLGTARPGSILNFDDYVGPGYSIPTPEMREAVVLLARTEGILLDPVYSGKAMAGLIGCARRGLFPRGSDVVFVHTGGAPALYAYSGYFLNPQP